MTDLLAIGASGINVYQRALSTVSNNIANLGTDGYSRQTTEIDQNEPQAAGKSFIGTGAYFSRVARQYDSFLEQSLQRATGDLESQKANAEYATRLLDFLGDDEIGLVSALNQFFSSAQQLSADPASTAYRSTMLRSSEELATRVNSLAEQLDDLGNQAFSSMQSEAESLNALAEQVASLNSQLLKKRLEENQPPALLDRRDQLLRDMSQFAQITTTTNSQGLVKVSLANSTTKGLLVDELKSRQLAVARDPKDPEIVSFQLNGGDGVEQLTGIRSGSIAGLNTFMASSLNQSKIALNDLVRTLADEVNTIQTSGLDLNGDMGQELFVIEPAISINQTNMRGAVQVQTTVLDGPVPEFDDLALTYNESVDQWSAIDPSTGRVVESDENGRIVLGNVAFTVRGTPEDNDRLLVSASNAPALGLRIGLETGDQIAAASLFRVTPAETNRGGAISSVIFDPVMASSGANTVVAEASFSPAIGAPIGVIPAGQREAILELNPDDASGAALQLLTRDGRHLIGTAGGAPSTSIAFFESGTQYDATYLNATTATTGSYKDYAVEYGAFADSERVTRVLPLSEFQFAQDSQLDFTNGQMEFTVQAPDTHVSLDLRQATSPNQTLGAISVVEDAVFLGQGASATQIGQITYPFGAVTSGPSRLRISFGDVTGIGTDALNQIARQFVVSDDRNLESTSHPLSGSVLVEAIDQNGVSKLISERTLNSNISIAAGATDGNAESEYALIDSDVLSVITTTGSVIGSGDVAINGQALGDLTVGLSGVDGYGALSALDVRDWVLAGATSDVTVDTRNAFRVDPSALRLTGAGLAINGEAIQSLNTGVQTSFTDVQDVVASINAVVDTTGVEAAVDANGALLISNSDGRGANILLESTAGQSVNLLGRSNGVVTGSFSIRQDIASENTLLLSLENDGEPADLNAIGLNTQIRIRGDLDEEIGVFLTDGPGTVSSEFVSSDQTFADGLRQRLYEVRITDDDTLEIRDSSTDTLVATRPYAGETVINYQGIQIELRAPAEAGDVFVIDGNNTAAGQTFDAQGNNQNLMRIVDLQQSEILNGLSITDAYLGIVGDVGNQSTQAEISVDALEIIKDQAIEARDRVSGVSLDREAADLIRFQQAYQASAQVMQVATRLFDAILQVR